MNARSCCGLLSERKSDLLRFKLWPRMEYGQRPKEPVLNAIASNVAVQIPRRTSERCARRSRPALSADGLCHAIDAIPELSPLSPQGLVRLMVRAAVRRRFVRDAEK